MPVDTKHPDYEKFAPVWQQCRDVAAGQRTIHARGTAYLPRLKKESESDYDARKCRATFFNATWRTIAGLTGLVMRKDPHVKVSNDGIAAMLEDVTQSGISLVNLAAKSVEHGLTVGRRGLLVDYPATSTAGMTQGRVEALNIRPKILPYEAESIINWDEEWIANKCVLSLVVLSETAKTRKADDEFAFETEPRWRVLDLVDAALDPDQTETAAGKAYRVRVFRKGKDGRDELVGPPVFPRMNGKRMPFIPFVFLGVDNTQPAVDEPPLIDLVYTNTSHYQSTADVEHGAHKTAMPQPYALGITPSGGPDSPQGGAAPTFYMGGGEIWLHPLSDGGFGMLEYTGQGLEAIEKRLERKEKHMAVLGARMLEDQKREVETAEVAAMHRSGEQSTLATQSKTVSSGIAQALAWFDMWAGGSGDVEFKLNETFLPADLTPEQITALVNAWQQGVLTSPELFEKFTQGGVIRDDKTYQEHESETSAEPPRLSAQGASGGGGPLDPNAPPANA